MRFRSEFRFAVGASTQVFPVELETVRDRVENAIVVHEFPGRNGAQLEHQGQLAQVITLRAYWFGSTYTSHSEFLVALKDPAPCEFIHPELGLLRGQIRSVTVNRDDRAETAEVDIEFVAASAPADPRPRPSIQAQSEESFEAAAAETQAAVTASLRATLGAEGTTLAAQLLDPAQPLLAQFTGLSAAARTLLGRMDSELAVVEGTLAHIENPANTIVGSIDFGLTLPGRVVGSLTRVVERYALAYQSIRTSPERFMRTLQAELTGLLAALDAFRAPTRSAGAAYLSLTAAALFSEDEDRRDEQRAAEGVAAFDAAGNLQAEPPSLPLMTVTEAEHVLAIAREEIQAAINADRENTAALRRMARDLLVHVRQVKIEYERVTPIILPSEMPLFLALMMAGLPHAYAERVASLNPHITRPNFASGRIQVYARPG